MNSKQKRSSGGYGLRRKVVRKRFDEDFEYYFSKCEKSCESKFVKIGDSSSKMHSDEFERELKKSNVKTNVKSKFSSGKKRGRPRKIQLSVQHQVPAVLETNLKFVDLKEKRTRKPKFLCGDPNETRSVADESNMRANMEDVAHEEEVEDSESKHLKLDIVLSEEMTELREEEVSSVPEGEKVNSPEEGVSLDSFLEERPTSGEVDVPEIEVFKSEEVKQEVPEFKIVRRYKRSQLSYEAVQKLSLLGPGDKVECSECHKLLKPTSFRQHLRTHSGEKPYGCEVCEAKFTRKGDVDRHVRIVHHKQKPFKCSKCIRAFGDKKNLRWHLMNHDKKLFYVCEVCGFKFGKHEYWANHVRFIHPLPDGFESVGEELDDEGFEALTDSLLEDESMEECYDNGLSGEFESVCDFVQTNIVQGATGMECKVIKTNGHLPMPMKNFPNVVKVSRPKECQMVNSPGVYIVSENSPVGAVVIEINDNVARIGDVLKSEQGEYEHPTNLIHIVSPKHEPEETNEVMDAQDCSAEDGAEQGSDHLLVRVDTSENDESLSGPEPSTKVFKLIVNSSDGNPRTNSNMHNLIEVLLDAASGQKHTAEVVQSS